MADLFRTSTVWVVDYRYDGRPRRWFKAIATGEDARRRMAAELQTLYGARARLVAVRPATDAEERLYLRGEAPKNRLCPTGRGGPLTDPERGP